MKWAFGQVRSKVVFCKSTSVSQLDIQGTRRQSHLNSSICETSWKAESMRSWNLLLSSESGSEAIREVSETNLWKQCSKRNCLTFEKFGSVSHNEFGRSTHFPAQEVLSKEYYISIGVTYPTSNTNSWVADKMSPARAPYSSYPYIYISISLIRDIWSGPLCKSPQPQVILAGLKFTLCQLGWDPKDCK